MSLVAVNHAEDKILTLYCGVYIPLSVPLELVIQRKPRATKLPELPSSIGTHNMHNVHEQMIRKQGNRPEAEYSVLDLATPVYVQDSRGAQWRPGTEQKPVDGPDSYWMQFPGGSVIRRTHCAFKMRPTFTERKVHSQQQEWRPECQVRQFSQPWGIQFHTLLNQSCCCCCSSRCCYCCYQCSDCTRCTKKIREGKHWSRSKAIQR